MRRVSVIILNYNTLHCLPRCLNALDSQTFRDFDILIVDNASADKSVDWLKRNRSDIPVIENETNQWYCRGNNIGIRNTAGEFALLLNPDVFLEPEFLDRAVRALARDPGLGGVQGKLWKLSSADSRLPQPGLRRIDTTGCLMTQSRRNFDRDQEERDDGRFDTPGPVFGPDGSAALYRREMLEDIRIGDEYFDEDFLAYREIVDLNWRARSRGWRFAYEPAAAGYHLRGFSPRTRHRQPVFVRRLSYRNRYLTLIKNETLGSLCRNPWRFLGFEILMLGYVLFREPALLAAWMDLTGLMPKMLQKRRAIQSRRTVSNTAVTLEFARVAPGLHRRPAASGVETDRQGDDHATESQTAY
ncbi:glycosyltransferase family 2 protein [bacterium]|nr:glycosyltransferase family 2 protein [candidate division CSSED10-310 bacterium]